MKTSFLPVIYGVITIILIGLVPCSVKGQVLTKRQLTETDYPLWSTMGLERLSEKGNWVSYKMSYENNVDTMFVLHTKTRKKFVFPTVRVGQFVGEDTFVFQRKEALVLFSLRKSIEQIIPNVERYDFSADGRFLVTLEKGTTLVIRKNGQVLDSIENVNEYQWNTESTKVVYATSENGTGAVGYISLKGNFTKQL